MNNIVFQYPWFAVLAFLPFIIYWTVSSKSLEKTGIPTIYNPSLKRFASAYASKNSISSYKGKFNYYLYVIWLLLVLCIMHPQQVEKIAKTTTKGYDIVLAIDLSKSMQALDFAESGDNRNRLDVLKPVAKKFITKRVGDRIGLVLFGESAFIQTPLTLDSASVAKILDLSEIGMVGDATSIGDAIAVSVKALLARPKGSRVIILMTDGSNTSGVISPVDALKIAKDYNIKIYTIGVGKKGNVPFPAADGQIVYAKMEIDESTLKIIANETGGEFFLAEDKQALEKIYSRINKLEKSEAEVKEIFLRNQLYKYPLMIAMFLFYLKVLAIFKWSRFFTKERK